MIWTLLLFFFGLPLRALQYSPPQRELWFVNTRSGGKQGIAIKKLLQENFGDRAVADLSNDGEAQDMLRDFAATHQNDQMTRCVVCGGDGTVGWVLSHIRAVHGLPLSTVPIAILPIGTGNDLARVLGWGGGVEKQIDQIFLEKYLIALRVATPERLDQWVTHTSSASPVSAITGKKPRQSSRDDARATRIDHVRELVMTNYLGIGIDAQVAQDFDDQRRKTPYFFFSRVANKWWYAFFGGRNIARSIFRRTKGDPGHRSLRQPIRFARRRLGSVLQSFHSTIRPSRAALRRTVLRRLKAERRHLRLRSYVATGGNALRQRSDWSSSGGDGCLNLHRKLTLFLDGERVHLPSSIQGVVFLNINSFMGGGRMWDAARRRGGGLWWTTPKLTSRSPKATAPCEGKQNSGANADDGILEVVAVDGSLHLARILLGMARPHQIGQATLVEIASSDTVLMQVDGEPRELSGPWKTQLEVSTEPALVLRNHDEELFSSGLTGTLTRHRLAKHLIKLYTYERA
jgi:hypothetical protein